ncbi:MAG: ArsA family ATPase [Acidimicrobiales bacterium]
MNVATFCRQSRVVIVAGKGGVGKTTVTAALARMAAQAGLDVLVCELEGKSGLAGAFGLDEELGYREVDLWSNGASVPGTVRGQALTPDDALIEYLNDHGLKRVSKRLAASGTLDVVATAAPGIQDILVLAKIKSLANSGQVDLIVVDAPAAGHAVTFLTSAHGLLDSVRVGPIRAQATDVIDMLSDPTRCQVLLVTLPEETPVNEVTDTAFLLEDRVGVSLGPVVVNGVYPVLTGLEVDPIQAAADLNERLSAPMAQSLAAAARFRLQRQELQATQIQRLTQALPLPQLAIPYLFHPHMGPPEIATLSSALADRVEGLAG